MNFYSTQISDKAIELAVKVQKSNYVSAGKVAEKFDDEQITIPIHSCLSDEEVLKVVTLIKSV